MKFLKLVHHLFPRSFICGCRGCFSFLPVATKIIKFSKKMWQQKSPRCLGQETKFSFAPFWVAGQPRQHHPNLNPVTWRYWNGERNIIFGRYTNEELGAGVRGLRIQYIFLLIFGETCLTIFDVLLDDVTWWISFDICLIPKTSCQSKRTWNRVDVNY